MKTTKEISRFLAKTDAGKKYIIVQYQEYNEITTYTESHFDEIPGRKYFKTSDGSDVESIDAKKYKIVPTGEIVHKT
jgi:hypothetical protein